jgi:NarL family two-component system response regulator LiaR
MTETIRVLIADDHPIVPEGLEVVLASETDMELVPRRRTATRRCALHPAVVTKLIKEIKRPSVLPPSAEPLTARELDVPRGLAQGLTNREIALELSISVRTVSNHVRSSLGKLHLANRTQAALYAVEQGLASEF